MLHDVPKGSGSNGSNWDRTHSKTNSMLPCSVWGVKVFCVSPVAVELALHRRPPGGREPALGLQACSQFVLLHGKFPLEARRARERERETGRGREDRDRKTARKEGRQGKRGRERQASRQTGREADRQRQRPTQERSKGGAQSKTPRFYIADWVHIVEKAAEPGKTAKDFFYQRERRQGVLTRKIVLAP